MKKKKKKRRKRKATSLAPPPIKSRKIARVVTSKFHEITHEIERLENKNTKLDHVEKRRMEALKQQLDELGGRQRYQDASKISTRHNRTVKYVCSILTKLNLRPKKKEPKLKVLEIGAINTHLLDVAFMDTMAIDLNSCNHRIKQIDFLKLQPRKEYDVVVSSMVINCVPTKELRLKMLLNIYEHLKINGHLFLILPLLCIRKSAFQDCKKFVKFLNEIGFKLKHSKTSPKLAFFCCEKNKDNVIDSNNNTISDSSSCCSNIVDEKKLLNKWGSSLKFQFAA